MKCLNQISFCGSSCSPCKFSGNEENCPLHNIPKNSIKSPTFGQWKEIYKNTAEKRRINTGLLEKKVIKAVVRALEQFRTVMELSNDDCVNVINRKSLAIFCSRLNVANVTKISKCQNIKQAFSKWIRIEFEDIYDLPRFDVPEIADDSPHFKEPSQAIKLSIANWYRSLMNRGSGKYKNRDRIFSMMMIKYAMRNGDVARLKWNNFIEDGGNVILFYTPHKTKHSSKRSVKVKMTPLDASDLKNFKKQFGEVSENDLVFGGSCRNLCNRLNKELRELGITGSKGMYIMRKLATHAIFKSQGRDAASALSGDDFSTIKRHYADIDSIDVRVLSDENYC